MTKLVLTIDWRTAAAGWPGGQLYLLDLEGHRVLDHYVGPLKPASLLQPGGWTGFRGVFCRGGQAYVADADSIRVFDLKGDRFRLVEGWTCRRWYDIHDTWPGAPDEEGRETWWITSTSSDEVVRVRKHGGHLLAGVEVWDAYLDPAVRNPETGQTGRRSDLHHINSVCVQGDQRWALAHRGGGVIRFAPGPTWIHPVRVHGGHSLRLTPQGGVLVLDTRVEKVLLLDPRGSDKPVRTMDCGAKRLAPKVNPNTGKRADSGWLRGCVVLDGQRAVVGTSPAQLFVVNYRTGAVEDYWQIDEKDVRASTFGLDVVM
ncbi:MAG: hypothetical protein ABIL09_25280 [Gemmatimonadota bacterium]